MIITLVAQDAHGTQPPPPGPEAAAPDAPVAEEEGRLQARSYFILFLLCKSGVRFPLSLLFVLSKKHFLFMKYNKKHKPLIDESMPSRIYMTTRVKVHT